jgi:hypothetical protein
MMTLGLLKLESMWPPQDRTGGTIVEANQTEGLKDFIRGVELEEHAGIEITEQGILRGL